MSDPDLDDLRSELDEFAQPEKKGGRSSREERIIAGFEEIQRFVAEHGRVPQHDEGQDIFERLYAVRLDRLRAQKDCWAVLGALDHQGLLTAEQASVGVDVDDLDDDALLAELGGGAAAAPGDVSKLQHVRSAAEKRAAEEIANRQRCEDFERFRPLFDLVQGDLSSGLRTTRQFVKDAGFSKAEIKAGQFFILGGQTAYVAEVGEPIKAPNGESDARLRVIYSNGTESDLLLRSLQRALYKDEAGRRITEPTAGPLFTDQNDEDDEASGIVYVLRSKSAEPEIVSSREILHKIGVTGGGVERRVANARLDPTFLMADVEVVATYELYNINRPRLENLIHRIFGAARLDIRIKDRFGNLVTPREWFLVPLFVIDEAIERIKDGTITGYVYDPKMARLTTST